MPANQNPPSSRQIEKYSRVAALLRYAGLEPGDIPRSPNGGLWVTMEEAQAEIARRGLTVDLPDELPPLSEKAARRYVRKLLGWDAHLIRLREGTKSPVEFAWQNSSPLSEDEAVAWLAGGGNLGILCSASGEYGWLVLDAENAPATGLLVQAGMVPTVLTANAQDPSNPDKFGGCHVWLPMPGDVDPETLKATLTVHCGDAGAIYDVMVGPRFLVAPGSRLRNAPGYRYEFADGGAAFRPELWGAHDIHWLLDPEVPAPDVAGIEPLHGVVKKKERVRRDPHPDGDRLTLEIDSIGWDEWIAGDPRVQFIGTDGRCGCDVFHWAGASEPRSAVAHDGCEYGYGLHVFSGTLEGLLGAPHVSRLRFAAFLRDAKTKAEIVSLAAEFGIQLGRQPLRGITLEDIAAVVGAPPALQVIAGSGADKTSDENVPVTESPRLSAVPRIGSVSGGSSAPAPEPEPEPEHDAFAGVGPTEDDEDTGELMFNRLDEIGDDEFWNSLPILRSVRRAAVANGIYAWGLLGAVLPRIACTIPPHVRLVGGSGKPGGPESGGSLNLNCILLGPPEAGKSETLKLAADLVRLPPHVYEIPSGTGEGIIKSFGYYKKAAGKRESGQDSGDGAAGGAPDTGVPATVAQMATNGYEYVHITDTVLLTAGEISDMVSEMGRQGTKTTSILRSMWVGEQVGTTAGEVERRTRLAPHSYRFGAVLGSQVEIGTLAAIFDEGKYGTAQRFGYFPVNTVPATGDPVSTIELPPIDWSGGSPAAAKIASLTGGLAPVWIMRPQAAHEEMEANKEKNRGNSRKAFSVANVRRRIENEENLDHLAGHELFHQFKFSAVLAVGDGLRQPTDLHWWAAGRIMAARAVVVETVVKILAVQREGADRAAGRSRGRSQAEARRAEIEAEDTYRAEIARRVRDELVAKGEPISGAEIAKKLGKAQGRLLTEILESMVLGGSLFHAGINRRGNVLYWVQPPADAAVSL